MSLPGAVLRHRRSTLQEIVQSLDAFDKTTDEIKEEKKTSGAVITIVCFVVIGILVFGQLKTYFYGDAEFEYKFTVDTAFDEQPDLELDMIVATPCTNLVAQLSGTAAEEFFLLNQFKRDPTRFEFTEREQTYWDELRRMQGATKPGGIVFKGLEKMDFISDNVEEGLKAEAEVKQREEAIAIEKERKNDQHDESFGGGAILLIGNGINVFHIIASNSQKDEGTACRVHGRVRVNKVKGDSVIITAGKGTGIDGLFAHVDGGSSGNISHRIERLNFGSRIGGLLTPLAGTEQISETGVDEYRYFLKVVPTRIFHNSLFGGSTMTYQYSVTKTHKRPSKREHMHPAIAIHYEFTALVIEVRQVQTSVFQLLVRLCSVGGGVFATSTILNALLRRVLCVCGFETCTAHFSKNLQTTMPKNKTEEPKYRIVAT